MPGGGTMLNTWPKRCASLVRPRGARRGTCSLRALRWGTSGHAHTRPQTAAASQHMKDHHHQSANTRDRPLPLRRWFIVAPRAGEQAIDEVV